jgi:hypothetical protein
MKSSLWNRCPLLLAGIVGTSLFASSVSADEILIYKLSAARNWQSNEVYYPNDSSRTSVRAQVNGTVRDASYLIYNNTTKDMDVVNYFTQTTDGGPSKVYTVTNYEGKAFDRQILPLVPDSNGDRPSEADLEYQKTNANATGTSIRVALKWGSNSDEDETTPETSTSYSLDTAMGEQTMTFLIGTGGSRVLGKAPNSVTLPEVAATIKGVNRRLSSREEVLDQAAQNILYYQNVYRGRSTPSATFDSALSLWANVGNVSKPKGTVDAVSPVATSAIGLEIVKQTVEKLGFDSIAPPVEVTPP